MQQSVDNSTVDNMLLFEIGFVFMQSLALIQGLAEFTWESRFLFFLLKDQKNVINLGLLHVFILLVLSNPKFADFCNVEMSDTSYLMFNCSQYHKQLGKYIDDFIDEKVNYCVHLALFNLNFNRPEKNLTNSVSLSALSTTLARPQWYRVAVHFIAQF